MATEYRIEEMGPRSPRQRSEDLWTEFQKFFKETVEAVPPCEVAWAWHTSANRTSFYRNRILPSVAARFGLIDVYELFRVDSTLCTGTTRTERDTLVPIIHVESENKANDASHEIRKLCALTSQLKVLIVCDTWSNEWAKGGHAQAYQTAWRLLIANHLRYYPDDCEYGLIAAEKRGEGANAKVYFYSMSLTRREVGVAEHGKELLVVDVAELPPCEPDFIIAAKPESLFEPKGDAN